jgi:hypothetical protein
MQHLKGIAILLVAALATSCGGGSTDDAPQTDTTAQRLAELQAQRSKWEASAAANYQYTFSLSCFCAFAGPYQVTVQSGKVSSAVYQGEGGATVSSLYTPTSTLSDLFDIAAEAISSHAAVVSYEVDPQYGHITGLYIDRDKNVIDEEVGYSASGYTPSPN